MIEPPHSTPDRSAQSARRARDPFLALANRIERNPWWANSGEWDLPPEKENRRQRRVSVRPPDALRTPTEAARKPRKPRKPTPEYLATLANKPGVARVEMKPDGTVLVTTGDSSAVDNNPWDVAAAALRQKKELQ